MMVQTNKVMGDIWGGLAAMLVALPSAIAFGVVSFTPLGSAYLGVGAMAGVMGTVVLGLVVSIVGGAPRLITAPCAPAAAVLSALTAELLAGRHGLAQLPPEQVLLLVAVVGLLSGGMQILFGVLGGGKVIKFIPYPVVSGYLSGVGVLIFLSQIPKLLGWPKGTDLWSGLSHPSLWQWTGIAVGLVTIAGMSLAPRITKAVPAPIIGLLAGISAYFAAGLWQPALYQLVGNPLLIGPISVDFPAMVTGMQERWNAVGRMSPTDVAAIVVPALTLSVLLSIDTLKTCVVVDALTRSRHNSNRTLIGQGIGNLLTAVVGGMPGAGTMGATLVSINSGGQTRLSGLLEGLFSLVVLLLFASLIGWVPIAALAGVLMVVAYRMFDWHSLYLLKHRSTLLDFLVIASVVVVAVGFNLIAAAGAGIGFAVVLFFRDQVHTSVLRRRRYGDQVSSKHIRLNEEKEILSTTGKLSTICELQGNLFFGTTDKLFTSLEQDIKTCRFLILDLRHVQSVDFTAIHMLEQIGAMLRDRDAYLILSDLPSQLPTGLDLGAYFEQTGLLSHGQNIKLFPYLDLAMEWVEDQLIEENRKGLADEQRPLALNEIPILRGLLNPSSLAILATSAEERSLAAGEKLFSCGDKGDEIFLIRRGQIRIMLPAQGDKGMTLAIFGRGNFFGEMVFLDLHHRPADAVDDVPLDLHHRSTDAVADVPTDLFVISRKNFDKVVRNSPELGYRFIFRLARALSNRLRFTSAELRELKEL
ncbi:MAG: SLC26A/SulP transporter family protein [Magnetococcales bacterium]|nr:SLC26A/SulP transporter family protein [Magnetococcales bacterium]